METATLAQIFTGAVKTYAARPALRWKKNKEWREMTYQDLQGRVKEFSGALHARGLKKGDRGAIFARNSAQWAVADWACVTSGFVTVPIYDTLTAEKAAYILKDSGSKVVVVQSKEHLDKVRSVLKQLPAIQ